MHSIIDVGKRDATARRPTDYSRRTVRRTDGRTCLRAGARVPVTVDRRGQSDWERLKTGRFGPGAVHRLTGSFAANPLWRFNFSLSRARTHARRLCRRFSGLSRTTRAEIHQTSGGANIFNINMIPPHHGSRLRSTDRNAHIFLHLRCNNTSIYHSH